jgi:putative endonuclease
MAIGKVRVFMPFVYILQSEKTGRYYIGSTNDLERRLDEHNSGHTSSLLYQRPMKIVFKKVYGSILEARQIERKLKKYKSRSIIERIIQDRDIKLGP